MPHDNDISRLIRRSILGLITPDEQRELQAWLDASPDNRRFYDWATSGAHIAAERSARRIIDATRPARDMERRIRGKRRARRVRTIARIAVAATLLGALSLLTWRFMPTGTQLATEAETPATAQQQPQHLMNINSLSAGSAKAILTTASGREQQLSASESGSSTTALLATVDNPSVTEQLSLEVPRGGEFKVILEDSTEVWLNSQSTLRYPETFGTAERRISLTGEAYIKVRKDPSRPFYVDTDRQTIRVYGTTFNVRAYPDEPATYTTLESGSISLTTTDGASGEVFLSRGHQAVLPRTSDRLALTVVDPSVVTSWHLGRFVFEDQPLSHIMRDLSRWYDFSYEFSDPEVGEQVFMGSIPRYSDFRTAIQILENCGDIRFTVTPDNTILISHK